MLGNPCNQIPLALLGKFNHRRIGTYGIPEIFKPLIRLPFVGLIGKHHGAVLRNIGQHFGDLIPIRLRKLKDVHIIHLNQGALCHHGHRFHGIGKGLDVKGFVVQLVEIEGLRQIIQQELLQLFKIVVQKKHFFTMKHIEIRRRTAANGSFQFLQGIRFFIIRLFRHGITS